MSFDYLTKNNNWYLECDFFLFKKQFKYHIIWLWFNSSNFHIILLLSTIIKWWKFNNVLYFKLLFLLYILIKYRHATHFNFNIKYILKNVEIDGSYYIF